MLSNIFLVKLSDVAAINNSSEVLCSNNRSGLGGAAGGEASLYHVFKMVCAVVGESGVTVWSPDMDIEFCAPSRLHWTLWRSKIAFLR